MEGTATNSAHRISDFFAEILFTVLPSQATATFPQGRGEGGVLSHG
jgi:hypothetical protein